MANSERAEHRFGGSWTEIKLNAVSDYLNFYTAALKARPSPADSFETFGTSDWETRFYEHQPAPTDLFDFPPPTGPSRNADPDKVEKFAAERLRSIFNFVSEPIPILTRRKLRQFSLFLLSGNSNERAIALIKKGVSAQVKKFGGR